MNSNKSFFSEQKFTAKEFFPYGLSRSGDFSLSQVKLLEQHGNAYKALQNGQRAPINEEERQFIEVLIGQKPASTQHELAWLRFLDKTENKVKVAGFSRSSGKARGSANMGEEEW